MRKRIRLSVTAFFCWLLVASVAWAMSSASYAINWDVIGGGGGPISLGSYKMSTTISQAAIGSFASASYRLGAGYWYGMAAPAPPPGYRIYLPIILKSHL